jgi:hypothetical protein
MLSACGSDAGATVLFTVVDCVAVVTIGRVRLPWEIARVRRARARRVAIGALAPQFSSRGGPS